MCGLSCRAVCTLHGCHPSTDDGNPGTQHRNLSGKRFLTSKPPVLSTQIERPTRFKFARRFGAFSALRVKTLYAPGRLGTVLQFRQHVFRILLAEQGAREFELAPGVFGAAGLLIAPCPETGAQDNCSGPFSGRAPGSRGQFQVPFLDSDLAQQNVRAGKALVKPDHLFQRLFRLVELNPQWA